MKAPLGVLVALGVTCLVQAQEPVGGTATIRLGFPPSATYKQSREAELKAALVQWGVVHGPAIRMLMVAATLTNMEGVSCESWNAFEPKSLQPKSDSEFVLLFHGVERLDKTEAPESTALHRVLISQDPGASSTVLFYDGPDRDLPKLFKEKSLAVTVKDVAGLKSFKSYRTGGESQAPLPVDWVSTTFSLGLRHLAAKAGTFIPPRRNDAFVVLSRSSEGVTARFSYEGSKMTAAGNPRLAVCEKPMPMLPLP